jgi:mannose-6-phosphate isomerase-like protein (cupin superfamily)
MAIYHLNANDVEPEKSAHGYTKFLHRSEQEGHPTIQIRHWGPDTHIPVHRHVFNEMFYVLEGEVEIGDKIYPAGSCIFIDKGTLYGPTRAPKGGTVLRYGEGKSK